MELAELLFLSAGSQCLILGWYMFVKDGTPVVLCTDCQEYKTEEFQQVVSCSSWPYALDCSRCGKSLGVTVLVGMSHA